MMATAVIYCFGTVAMILTAKSVIRALQTEHPLAAGRREA